MITSSLLLPRLGMSCSLGLTGRTSLDFDMFQYSNSGFNINGCTSLVFLTFRNLLGITTGSLIVKNNATIESFTIPKLHAVSGSFELSSSLINRLNLPKLSTVGGNFTIANHQQFPFGTNRISASTFPSMSYVGGNITLYDNGNMDVNSLLSMSVNLNGGTWANTLKITGSSNLMRVAAATGVGRTYMDTLNARGATLIVPVTQSVGNTEITESAGTVSSLIYDNYITMSGFSAPNLTTVNGAISFRNVPALTYYSLPVLDTVTGNYFITGSHLTSLTLTTITDMSNQNMNFNTNSLLTTILTASTITGLGNFEAGTCSLTQASVDNILKMLVNANGSTWAAYANLRGGYNAAPSSIGPGSDLFTLNSAAGPPFFGRGATVATN
jgi:hypothetical protein